MSRRRCTRPKTLACQVLDALEDAAELYDGQSWLGLKKESRKLGRKLADIPRSEKLDVDKIAHLARGEVELEHILRLLDALTRSASNLLSIYRRRLQPSATKLSKGLASLPDELLSLICKFATHHEQEGTRYAVWLSQVSRRFRAIVLGDRSLWTTQFLWYDTTKESVEMCIGRTGEGSDLHVVVNANITIARSCFGVMNFLKACSPFQSRWRTLTLSSDWVLPDDGIVGTIGDYMGGLTHGQRWVLPRLHELVLNQRHYDDGAEELLWCAGGSGYFQHFECDAPNLRVLRCTQYIPPPSFPFKSITRFELSLTFTAPHMKEQIQELLACLCSMKTIADLDLELINYHGADEGLKDEMDFEYVFACEAVQSFRLKVTEFSLPNGARCLLSPFMGALEMPLLEHLSLSIALKYGDVYYFGFGGDDGELVPELVSILLPDPDFHTNLSSLTIDLPIPEALKKEGLLSWRTTKQMYLTIPLDEVPQLSTLNVTTFCCISFSRADDSEESFPERIEKCSLRELRLDGCGNLDAKRLEDTIQSLKDVDAWDTLDRIVIKNCGRLDYNSALDAVGEERLRFADR